MTVIRHRPEKPRGDKRKTPVSMLRRPVILGGSDFGTTPKLIHQIWIGRPDMPERCAQMIADLRAMNPDWDHVLWTDAEAEGYFKTDPVLRKAASGPDRIPAAMLSDRLRFLILRDYGGVYIDADTIPVRPLDDLHEMFDEKELVIGKRMKGNVSADIGVIWAAYGSSVIEELLACHEFLSAKDLIKVLIRLDNVTITDSEYWYSQTVTEKSYLLTLHDRLGSWSGNTEEDVADHLSIVITGHPRSGTGFAAKVAQNAGFGVGHETIGEHGISSWAWAVRRTSDCAFGTRPRGDVSVDTVVYLLREPIACINSVALTEYRSEPWRSRFVNIPRYSNPFERAIHSIWGWKNMAMLNWPVGVELVATERFHQWAEANLKDEIEPVNNGYNSRPRSFSLTRNEISACVSADANIMLDWLCALHSKLMRNYQNSPEES